MCGFFSKEGRILLFLNPPSFSPSMVIILILCALRAAPSSTTVYCSCLRASCCLPPPARSCLPARPTSRAVVLLANSEEKKLSYCFSVGVVRAWLRGCLGCALRGRRGLAADCCTSNKKEQVVLPPLYWTVCSYDV